MKYITAQQLTNFNACRDGVEAFVKRFGHRAPAKAVFAALFRGKKLDWANWLIARLLSRKDKIRYAIYAAGLVLEIFEKKYPDDDRPRKAIKAARVVLKKNNVKTRSAASAASAAAYAAADAADAAMKTRIIRYGIRLLERN